MTEKRRDEKEFLDRFGWNAEDVTVTSPSGEIIDVTPKKMKDEGTSEDDEANTVIEKTNGELGEVIDGLDSALAKASTTKEVFVYRTFGSFEIDNLTAGCFVDDLGFMSTSLDPFLFFGVVGRIRVPKGARAIFIADISYYPDECELLIDRGARLKVTEAKHKVSIEFKDGGTRDWQIVEMELILP